MLRKTFQNISHRIKAHSDMGKALIVCKIEDSNEKVEAAILSFIIDSSQIGSLDKPEPAIACFRKILKIAHPVNNRKDWRKVVLQLAAYFHDRYKCERNENSLMQLIELPSSNDLLFDAI